MAFTGHENQYISLETASAWTENYRNANPNSINGHYFSMDTINGILAQGNCLGIRVYYAIDDAGVKQLVIVGTDAYENDLYEGLIADKSIQCPPTCGAINPLNS